MGKFNLLIKTAEGQPENKNLKKIKIFDTINKLKKWALCKNIVPFYINVHKYANYLGIISAEIRIKWEFIFLSRVLIIVFAHQS